MGTPELGSVRTLHDVYAGPLYVFAYRRLRDPQAAEEVVQDTLVRAWRARDRYDAQRGPVAAWLFTIARNLVIDRVRHIAARPEPSTLPAGLVEPVDEIDRMLETWQIADALSGLSVAHREAILACHYRGHTVTEAAALLGVPDGTVKSRLYYGLRALRLRLEEMGVVG
ncbi:sigma-70 family RNA polymerase sigma factor [soil metagenome]